MKKLIIIYLILILFIGCSSGPKIIREMVPIAGMSSKIDSNRITEEKEGVRITVEYLNRDKLQKIAKENNPYTDSSGFPILTTFKITIENTRDSKIKFEPENAILLDGLGNQFNALTYEAFKELYPTSVYQRYEYSFIFNRYYIDTYWTDDYKKRSKAVKSLFKGGYIYSGVKVEGIVPFQQLSEYSREVTLILPDIILYEKAGGDEDLKEMKRIEFSFKFRQEIRRED